VIIYLNQFHCAVFTMMPSAYDIYHFLLDYYVAKAWDILNVPLWEPGQEIPVTGQAATRGP
jgi:hypothetical protein